MQTIIKEDELIRYEQPVSTCDDKLNTLEWVAHHSYEIGNYRFGVRTTSHRFSSWIDEVLARNRVDGHEDPFYSIVVANGGDNADRRGKRDFHILYQGVWPVVRTLELTTVGYALLARLETHLFEARSDLIFLDAIAVPIRDKIALLTGSILPNLAELGPRARRYGITVSAATNIAIDPESGRVMPLPRQVLTAADATQALELLGSGGEVRDLFVVREPLDVDIVGTWDARRGRAFEPLPRAETLHHLAEGVFNLKAMGRRVLTGLGQLVENADCYGLVPMPPPRMAEGLASLA